MQLEGSLIPIYREMHIQKPKRYSSGSTVVRYVAEIRKLIDEIPTESILDYGCGKGTQYTVRKLHLAWGIMPALFDPGVPKLDKLPSGQFDGVICTGVLEHIPKRELPIAFSNLARYAGKWCFLVIGTALSHKTLPNGENAHATIQPREWWQKRLRDVFSPHVRVWLGFEP